MFDTCISDLCAEFGSACHMGVCLDVPCIGIAKKLFQVGGLEKNQEHLEKVLFFALIKQNSNKTVT